MLAIAAMGIASSLVLRTSAPNAPARVAPIEAATLPSSPQVPPDIGRDVVGFQRLSEGNEIVFIPDSGLFASGSAALTVRAKGLLTTLGRHLEPYRNNLGIRVVGYTDHSPMMRNGGFKDNNALGMARAVTVYEFLRWNTEIPSVALSLASNGDVGAPYSASGEATSARNRTVVIRVTARR
jgi:flagellar motor protein MotB